MPTRPHASTSTSRTARTEHTNTPAASLDTLAAIECFELEARRLFDGVVLDGAAATPDEVLDGDLISLSDFNVVELTQTSVSGIQEPLSIDINDSDDVEDLSIQTTANSIGILPNGHYVMTWAQRNDAASTWDVFAQIYNANGEPHGPSFQINQYSTGDQQWASIAVGRHGNFVITWTSDGQDGHGAGVYARQFNAQGTPLGDEFLVNSFTHGNQFKSAVEFDRHGNFVIVWEGRGAGDLHGIFGQRFLADGTKLGNEFRVNAVAGGIQSNPTISVNDSGAFVVGWIDNDQFYLQRYNGHGLRVGTAHQLVDAADVSAIDIWLSNQGRIVVAWTETSNGTESSYYQLFDATLNPLTFKTALGPTSPEESLSMPSISGDAGGNFLIAWHARGESLTNGVYVSLFDEHGNIYKPPVLVAEVGEGTFVPSIAALNIDDFAVAWYSDKIDEMTMPQHRLFFTDFRAKAAAVGTPPVIDGIVDPGWTLADYKPLQQVVRGAESADGFSARFATQWDAQHLYVLLRVIDTQFAGMDGVHGEVDSLFTLFVDGNASRGFATQHGSDLQLVFRPSDATVWNVSSTGEWTPIEATFALRATANGFIVEGAIPWSIIGVAPTVDRSIGLDWLVHRFDEQGQPTTTLAWNATVSPTRPQPVLWGTVTLAAPPASVVPPTGALVPAELDQPNVIAPSANEPPPSEPPATAITNPQDLGLRVVESTPMIEFSQAPLPAPTNESAPTNEPTPTTEPIGSDNRHITIQPVNDNAVPQSQTSDHTVTLLASEGREASETHSGNHVEASVVPAENTAPAVPPEIDRDHQQGAWFHQRDNEVLIRNDQASFRVSLIERGWSPAAISALTFGRNYPHLSASALATQPHATASTSLPISLGSLSFNAVIEQVAEQIVAARSKLDVSTGVLLAAGVSGMMTIGYLTWAVRGGILLAGAVSAVPVWQSFDPLPVLQSAAHAIEEGESLEAMVSRQMETAA